MTLARWGRRVICIDWDLEAPGLELYFAPYIRDRHTGLLDLVEAMRDSGAELPLNDYKSRLRFPEEIELDFIPAGYGDGYSARVQNIDWTALFQEHDFAAKLEQVRQDLKIAYDYILIDSRTGLSDIGSICAVQLPDILVMLVNTNNQSIEGTVEIANRIPASRDALSFDRLALPIIPILSRFDAREERVLGVEWQARISDRLCKLYEPWLPKGMKTLDVLERTTIPYVPSWSFGERIPVLEERSTSPESITWAIENVAALLAIGVSDVASLVSDRDAFVRTARTQSLVLPLTYDLFISCDVEDQSKAGELAKVLSRDNLLVAYGGGDPRGEGWQDELQATAGASVHLVMLVGNGLSRRQESALKVFLGETVLRDLDNQVVVVGLTRDSLRLPKGVNYQSAVEWTSPARVAAEIEYALSLRGPGAVRQWAAVAALREQLLGSEHLSTVNSRANRALAYEAVGNFSEAIPLFEQTVADRERLLGADHADTLVSIASLAEAYEAAGQVSRAIPLLKRIVAVRERVLGPKHPDTLVSRLALRLAEAGRHGEALATTEEAVAIYRQLAAARPDAYAPDLALTLNNLANQLADLGRSEEALAAREEAVIIYPQLAARDLPPTLNNLSNSPADDIGRQAYEWLLAAPGLDIAEVRGRGVDPEHPGLIRIGLPDRGARFPAFQFDASGQPHAVVTKINLLLDAARDPLGAADWWLGPNAWLGDIPAEMIGRIADDDLLGAVAAVLEAG